MKKVFQSLNGQIFFSEKEAKEYYGERFESALAGNILYKFVIDADYKVISEW